MSADIQLEDLVDLYDDLTRATDEVRRIIETLTGSSCIEGPTSTLINAGQQSNAGHRPYADPRGRQGISAAKESHCAGLAASRAVCAVPPSHQSFRPSGQHASIQSLVESLSGLMSQQQIAKLIGVSRYTISNMLQDIRANQPPGRRKGLSFRLQGIGRNTPRPRGCQEIEHAEFLGFQESSAKPAHPDVLDISPNIVNCSCGQSHPTGSFGAGFIALNGRCKRCATAMSTERARPEFVSTTSGHAQPGNIRPAAIRASFAARPASKDLILWPGLSDAPVADGTTVSLRFRDGTIAHQCVAGVYTWRRRDLPDDIEAYRRTGPDTPWMWSADYPPDQGEAVVEYWGGGEYVASSSHDERDWCGDPSWYMRIPPPPNENKGPLHD